MSFIPWTDALSVGISQVDDQHKKLLGFVNDLHDAMKARRGRDAVGDVLNGLVAYTKEHFGNEEALMQASGYPRLAQHQQQHRALTQQVDDLLAKQRAGQITVSLDTMNFIRDWLQNHIQRSDKEAGIHMKASGRV